MWRFFTISLAGCLLALPACNQVFGLEPVERHDGAAAVDGDVTDADLTDADLTDDDGDGIVNSLDNCDHIVNPLQRDYDSDGIGDRCDPCPDRPGDGGPNVDGDGVGDLCDYDKSNRQCIAWFDSFDSDTLGHYATNATGGSWAISGGVLSQNDDSTSDGLLLTMIDFEQPWVRTVGTALSLRTAPVSAVAVDGHNLGVWTKAALTANPFPLGCLAEINQLVPSSDAKIALFRNAPPAPTLTEFGGVSIGAPLTVGARFVVEVAATAANLSSRGAIDNLSVENLPGDNCDLPAGKVGLRTRYTTAQFDYLMVVDVRGSCPAAPATCVCPPPPEL